MSVRGQKPRTLEPPSGTLVGFTPGPSCGRVGEQRPRVLQVLATLERQPSYYEPICVIRCARCGDDYTVHPGSYRDGPAIPSEAVWARLMENPNWPRWVASPSTKETMPDA